MSGQLQQLPAFHIDRFEVTNRQFKAFVDARGYERPELWKEPSSFAPECGGANISFREAIDRFRRRHGPSGPATWAVGLLAEGAGGLSGQWRELVRGGRVRRLRRQARCRPCTSGTARRAWGSFTRSCWSATSMVPARRKWARTAGSVRSARTTGPGTSRSGAGTGRARSAICVAAAGRRRVRFSDSTPSRRGLARRCTDCDASRQRAPARRHDRTVEPGAAISQSNGRPDSVYEVYPKRLQVRIARP